MNELIDVMKDLDTLLCEFEQGNKEEGLWNVEKRKEYFGLEVKLVSWILYAIGIRESM